MNIMSSYRYQGVRACGSAVQILTTHICAKYVHSTSALKDGGWTERHVMNVGARHEDWFPPGVMHAWSNLANLLKFSLIDKVLNKSPSFCFLLHHWTGSTKARYQTSVPSIKSIHRPIIPQKSQQKSMIILKCYDPLRWPGGCLHYYSTYVTLWLRTPALCLIWQNGKEAKFLPICYTGIYIYLPFTSVKQFPFNLWVGGQLGEIRIINSFQGMYALLSILGLELGATCLTPVKYVANQKSSREFSLWHWLLLMSSQTSSASLSCKWQKALVRRSQWGRQLEGAVKLFPLHYKVLELTTWDPCLGLNARQENLSEWVTGDPEWSDTQGETSQVCHQRWSLWIKRQVSNLFIIIIQRIIQERP